MRASLIAALILLPGLAFAQGFAGLGTTVDGYATVQPNRTLSFPEDHGPHDAYRIEWWYVTANLEGSDGTPYGVQFTLFRQAAAPPPQREGWESQQFWLGHAALTTPDAHLYAEKLARGGSGQAGAKAAPFDVWIDDWQMKATGVGIEALSLIVASETLSYDLTLTTDRDLVLQGERGYSVKSDRGQASYYYSQPYFSAEGTVTAGGEAIPVTGRAWMDREWSSQPLAADQSGWDWFSIHLGPTTKLMLFRLRADESADYVSGNWIEGSDSTPISADQIEMQPLSTTRIDDRTIPTDWRVAIPSKGVDLSVSAINPMAWNGTQIGYWEGPVTVSGSHDSVGYLEMTGY